MHDIKRPPLIFFLIEEDFFGISLKVPYELCRADASRYHQCILFYADDIAAEIHNGNIRVSHGDVIAVGPIQEGGTFD